MRIGGQSVGAWTLSARVPHWAAGAVGVTVNGTACDVESSGYVRVTRDFQPGDVVEITLAMEPRFTVADPRVDAVGGCVAVERGPEVMCLESVDTPGNMHVDLLRVDDTVAPREGDGAVLVSVTTMTPTEEEAWPYARHRPGEARDDLAAGDSWEVALQPYHSWGNRGPTTMRVWLPTGRA